MADTGVFHLDQYLIRSYFIEYDIMELEWCVFRLDDICLRMDVLRSFHSECGENNGVRGTVSFSNRSYTAS